MSRPIVYPMQMVFKILLKLHQTPVTLLAPLLNLVGPNIAMVILGERRWDSQMLQCQAQCQDCCEGKASRCYRFGPPRS